MLRHSRIAFSLALLVGCYESHSPLDGGEAAVDAAMDATVDSTVTDTGVADARDSGVACDLRGIQCTALPGCLGDDPPATLYCDDLRICIPSDPGDLMATAIAEVASRIQCFRADSCDFLCAVTDGGFDDDVRRELCDITRVAPSAQIECAVYGP